MARASIPSRYAKATIISDSGVTYTGIRPQVATEPRATDIFYTVQSGDTLHHIAARQLGDPRLWWVVADFNDVLNPFDALIVGATVRLPSQQRLWTEVLA